jgi:hypothetical protein
LVPLRSIDAIGVQRRASVAEEARMNTPIPLRSTSFSPALEWARLLGRRAQRDFAGRLARDLWTVAVEAGLARGHATVVANLLATELVPALGQAMEALGQAVMLCGTPPRERHATWSVEMLPRLDGVVSKHRRACDVLVVAERRCEAFLGGPPPLFRALDGVNRVLDRVLDDVELERLGRDPWPGVAERLGQALTGLVGPVDAVVERIDAGDLDGAPLVPLKRAMLTSYEDLCEALLFALGRLGLEPRWAPQRIRATA